MTAMAAFRAAWPKAKRESERRFSGWFSTVGRVNGLLARLRIAKSEARRLEAAGTQGRINRRETPSSD